MSYHMSHECHIQNYLPLYMDFHILHLCKEFSIYCRCDHDCLAQWYNTCNKYFTEKTMGGAYTIDRDIKLIALLKKFA